MSEVEELELRIKRLPPQEMAKLRDWFLELDNDCWDEEIASDFKAGKFNELISRARQELAQGEAREI